MCFQEKAVMFSIHKSYNTSKGNHVVQVSQILVTPARTDAYVRRARALTHTGRERPATQCCTPQTEGVDQSIYYLVSSGFLIELVPSALKWRVLFR